MGNSSLKIEEEINKIDRKIEALNTRLNFSDLNENLEIAIRNQVTGLHLQAAALLEEKNLLLRDQVLLLEKSLVTSTIGETPATLFKRSRSDTSFSSVALITQLPYDGTKKLLTVENLTFAGLSNEVNKELFMRDENIRIWQALAESSNHAMILLNGCPGVGKSLLVLAYVIWYCQSTGKSLLYCHYADSAVAFILATDGSVHTMEGGHLDIVKKCRHHCDITVMDGWYDEAVFKAAIVNFPIDRKLIICTSFEAVHLNSETRCNLGYRLIDLTMMSWTLADFTLGVKEGVFQGYDKTSFDVEDKIETRFRITGGSVRLFCCSMDLAKDIIDSALFTKPDYIRLYAGWVQPQSQFVVNTLMALYPSNRNKKVVSVPLSQYVLEKLEQLCWKSLQASTDFIRQARCTLPLNPSWQGWVTEVEVISLLRRQGRLTVYSSIDKEISEELVCNGPPLLLKASEFPNLQVENKWFIPYRLNQPLWDAVRALPGNKLGVCQINGARRSQHIYKFSHLLPLVEATRPTSIELLTICTKSNFEEDLVEDWEGYTNINEGGVTVHNRRVWYEGVN